MIFQTERLLIRPYIQTDFENFFRMSNDEEVMRYIRPVQTRLEAEVFFKKIMADYELRPGLGRWAMLTNPGNIFVGSFAVIPVENSTDIQLGYSLLPEYWGKGYAFESVRGGLDYAFNILKLEKVLGVTESPNTASQKVLTKAGFQYERQFMEGEKLLLVFQKSGNAE